MYDDRSFDNTTVRDEVLTGSFDVYSAHCLCIRTKDSGLTPLILNDAQRYLDDIIEEQIQQTGRVRIIVLKGRQEGVSTYVEARFIRHTTTKEGKRAFILTHEQDATENLFEIAERFYDNLPLQVKPVLGTSNAKELSFCELDSGYRIGTAGNKAVGRSQTIQYFHGSEVAYWPNAGEHTKGVLQAVPDAPDTEIILESTANGVNNFFHQFWKTAEKGLSDFWAVFLPWFWMPEYQKEAPKDFQYTQEENDLAWQYGLTRDQLYWRRFKIRELDAGDGIQDGETAFKQEYPMNAAEAFQFSGGDTLISSAICMKARKRTVKGSGLLIVGVDPSAGGDRFAIIRRHGRKLYGEETYRERDVDVLSKRVSICHRILTEIDPEAGKVPDFMHIDYARGDEIVDELRGMGHQNVRTVNFGTAPFNPEKYTNKRNEMWGEMAGWLYDEAMPPEIPDSDEMQADLCASPYRWDSKERAVLRDKLFIKKEFGFSPDLGDAAALTFAVPYRAEQYNYRPHPILPRSMDGKIIQRGRVRAGTEKLNIGKLPGPEDWSSVDLRRTARRPKPIKPMGKT